MLIRPASHLVIATLAIAAIVASAPGCGRGSPAAPTPVLTVTSITPSTAATVSSSRVTIGGAGFMPGATVTLGLAATSVTVVNAATITAMSPEHAAGTVDVLVINPGGQNARLAGAFRYIEPIYTLTPSQNTVAPVGPLSVSWTAPQGGTWDWIGLFRVGDPNTNYDQYWWRYTEGVVAGTFALTAPAQLGDYEFRYLLNDGYVDVIRSSVVTVR